MMTMGKRNFIGEGSRGRRGEPRSVCNRESAHLDRPQCRAEHEEVRMADSTVWWLLAGTAVAVELVTGTFYLLMLGIGLAAGAIAAHLGAGIAVQLVVGALIGGG